MRELAKRREEIDVAPVDAREKLNRYPLIVVELCFGLVQRVAHNDPVKHGCGIALVMSKPQVRLQKIPAQHVYAFELLHSGVDPEVRAAEQLMHHTSSLSPLLFLLYHCALSVAHKITRDGHIGSLVGNFRSLGYGFQDDAVRVEHNPRLGSHVQRHHFTVRYQGGQLPNFSSRRIFLLDKFKTHPFIE